MAGTLPNGWSVKGAAPSTYGPGGFAAPGMKASAPSSSSLGTGGLDPLTFMSLFGGGNKGGAEESSIVQMQKNPYSPVNVDYSASNYGDLVNKALGRI